MVLRTILLLSLFVEEMVYGLPSGPPIVESVCVDLMPSTAAPHRFQSGNGTYKLTTTVPMDAMDKYFSYEGGVQYDITLSSTGVPIRGFLVQAWNPSEDRIGSFTAYTGQTLLNCNSVSSSIPSSATIGHNRRNQNSTVSFKWTAPAGGDGLVDFRFTIVRGVSMYFGPLSAAAKYGVIQDRVMTTTVPDATIAVIKDGQMAFHDKFFTKIETLSIIILYVLNV